MSLRYLVWDPAFLSYELSIFDQCYQCIYFAFTKHCEVASQSMSGCNVTKFKNSFSPILIYWNDNRIHLGIIKKLNFQKLMCQLENMQIFLRFIFLCRFLFTLMPERHQDSA